MTAPTFAAAGAGATTTGATLSLPAVSGLSGGEKLLAIAAGNDWDAGESIATPDGWSPVTSYLLSEPSGVGFAAFVRDTAAAAGSDGAVDLACGMGGPKGGRVFAFSSATHIFADAIAGWKFSPGEAIAPTIVTGGPNALGLAILIADPDVSLPAFTGETGADWTEPVAEYQVPTTGPTIQLQTCSWTSGSGVSGGGTGADPGDWFSVPLVVVGTAQTSGFVEPYIDYSQHTAIRRAGSAASSLEQTVDLELLGDMQPHAPEVSAGKALVQRCRQRLISTRDMFPWWPGLGTDLYLYRLSKVPEYRVAEAVKAEMLQEEQVLEAVVRAERLAKGQTIRLSITLGTSFEQDYRFTLDITNAAATLVALEQAY